MDPGPWPARYVTGWCRSGRQGRCCSRELTNGRRLIGCSRQLKSGLPARRGANLGNARHTSSVSLVGRLGRSPTGGDGFLYSRALSALSGYWRGVAHRRPLFRGRPGRRRPRRRRAQVSRLRPQSHRRRCALRPRHAEPRPRRCAQRPRHGEPGEMARTREHIRMAAAARLGTWSSPSLRASSPTSSQRSRDSRSTWSTREDGHAPSMLALGPSGW